MSNVSRAKAQKVLDVVVDRYAQWFQPIYRDDDPGSHTTLPDGSPRPVLVAADDKPTLQEPGVQCNGWAIVWEEGPSDWPHQVTMGGSTEEERALLAEANAEFGTAQVAAEPEPVTMPAGVYAEPVNHVTLGVYAA